MSKFDSLVRACSGEETSSEGRGDGASQTASEAFAGCQGQQLAGVGERAPGKERIGEGESFPFSADHAEVSILGLFYYELRGSDNPSEREFPAFL